MISGLILLLFNWIFVVILSSKIDFKVEGIILLLFRPIVPSFKISGLWIKSFPFLIFGLSYPFELKYSTNFFCSGTPTILPVIFSNIWPSFSLIKPTFILSSGILLFSSFNFVIKSGGLIWIVVFISSFFLDISPSFLSIFGLILLIFVLIGKLVKFKISLFSLIKKFPLISGIFSLSVVLGLLKLIILSLFLWLISIIPSFMVSSILLFFKFIPFDDSPSKSIFICGITIPIFSFNFSTFSPPLGFFNSISGFLIFISFLFNLILVSKSLLISLFKLSNLFGLISSLSLFSICKLGWSNFKPPLLIFNSFSFVKYSGISNLLNIYSDGFKKLLFVNIISLLILSSKIDFKVEGIILSFLLPFIVPSIIISGLWIKSFPFIIFGLLYPFELPYSTKYFCLGTPIILPVILSNMDLSFSFFNFIKFSSLIFGDSFSFIDNLSSFSSSTGSFLFLLVFILIPGIIPLIISSFLSFLDLLIFSFLNSFSNFDSLISISSSIWGISALFSFLIISLIWSLIEGLLLIWGFKSGIIFLDVLLGKWISFSKGSILLFFLISSSFNSNSLFM